MVVVVVGGGGGRGGGEGREGRERVWVFVWVWWWWVVGGGCGVCLCVCVAVLSLTRQHDDHVTPQQERDDKLMKPIFGHVQTHFGGVETAKKVLRPILVVLRPQKRC